jgi:hypothetical protein
LFCNPINGQRCLGWRTIYPCTCSDPSLLSHNLSTTLNTVLCSWLVGCATVQLLGCRRSRFLHHKVHTFLSNICVALLWYKHERIYALEMGILPRR